MRSPPPIASDGFSVAKAWRFGPALVWLGLYSFARGSARPAHGGVIAGLGGLPRTSGDTATQTERVSARTNFTGLTNKIPDGLARVEKSGRPYRPSNPSNPNPLSRRGATARRPGPSQRVDLFGSCSKQKILVRVFPALRACQGLGPAGQQALPLR